MYQIYKENDFTPRGIYKNRTEVINWVVTTFGCKKSDIKLGRLINNKYFTVEFWGQTYNAIKL